MIRYVHIPFAIGIVLAASADWRIEPAGICAVDQTSCERALDAHRVGWANGKRLWPEAVMTECHPAPGCRDEREDFIDGFNLPERLR